MKLRLLMPVDLKSCCKRPEYLRIRGYTDSPPATIPIGGCGTFATFGGTEWDGTLIRYGEGYSCKYFGPLGQPSITGVAVGDGFNIRLEHALPILDPHVPGQKFESTGVWIFSIYAYTTYTPPPAASCTFLGLSLAYRAMNPNMEPTGWYNFVQGCGRIALRWYMEVVP